MSDDYDDDVFDDGYDDEYYDDDDRVWPAWALGVGGFVVAAAVVWFLIGAITGGDDAAAPTDVDRVTTDTTVGSAFGDAGTSDTSASTTATSDPAATTDDETTDEDETTTDDSTDGAAASTSGPTAPVGDDAVGYATLPDGSPVPVLAIFDDDLITLSGVVPSEDAAERLRILALANSASADAQVASFLTVDPEVPLGVGVRMIDVAAAQFEEGSPTIPPAYVAQLDRVAALMNSLPNVTVDVIGHTDQTGDDDANFELSTNRARATADYLVAQDIDPTRVSARGAGSTDLLTLNNDEASMALNRRTEFVVYGLLVDDA